MIRMPRRLAALITVRADLQRPFLTLCTPNVSVFKGLIDESQGESGTDAASPEPAPSLRGFVALGPARERARKGAAVIVVKTTGALSLRYGVLSRLAAELL